MPPRTKCEYVTGVMGQAVAERTFEAQLGLINLYTKKKVADRHHDF